MIPQAEKPWYTSGRRVSVFRVGSPLPGDGCATGGAAGEVPGGGSLGSAFWRLCPSPGPRKGIPAVPAVLVVLYSSVSVVCVRVRPVESNRIAEACRLLLDRAEDLHGRRQPRLLADLLLVGASPPRRMGLRRLDSTVAAAPLALWPGGTRMEILMAQTFHNALAHYLLVRPLLLSAGNASLCLLDKI